MKDLQDTLLATWLQIGRNNYWISQEQDPPINEMSFYPCKSIRELRELIQNGNWGLGQAFYYENVCFINQINGGDEWLAIRNNSIYDSISFEGMTKEGEFENYINRIIHLGEDD